MPHEEAEPHDRAPTEVTRLLGKVCDGDEVALKAVFTMLYPELRRLASSRLKKTPSSGTVTPTVLVHEAYLKFVGAAQLDVQHRSHFFAVAARAMRQVLMDYARRINSEKRGGELQRVTLRDDLTKSAVRSAAEILDLDRGLDELAKVSERALKVVELRFFAGRSAAETADLLDISLRTTNREWQKARTFLESRLTENVEPVPSQQPDTR